MLLKAEEKEERKERKRLRKEKQEAKAEAKRLKDAKKGGGAGTEEAGDGGAEGKVGEADISELRAGVVPGNMSKKQRKAAAAAKEAAEVAAAAAAAAVTAASTAIDKKKTAGDESDSSSEAYRSKKKKQKKEDNRVWVQCNTCDKWRALPPETDSSKLPDIWICSLNDTDKERNHCEAPEENFDEEDLELKSFAKVWVKRLRNADRIESKLSNTAATIHKSKIAKVNSGKGQRGKVDVDWIQCSNPACGKWRAVSRGLDTKGLLARMERGKFRDDGEWFCSMNNWDETTASCAAPQEQLWNTRWNLD